MRICVIGKFPPIHGGVSMRTYWSAHALAARDHPVNGPAMRTALTPKTGHSLDKAANGL